MADDSNRGEPSVRWRRTFIVAVILGLFVVLAFVSPVLRWWNEETTIKPSTPSKSNTVRENNLEDRHPESIAEASPTLAPAEPKFTINVRIMPTPLLLAQAATHRDAGVIGWLTLWKGVVGSGHVVTDSQRLQLSRLLAQTRLSCSELFAIAGSLENLSHDSATAAVLYQRALQLAHDDLARYPIGSSESRQILVAMHGAKLLLWRVIEAGDSSYGSTMYQLNSDLLKYIDPTDKSLSNDREHGKIGMVEALCCEGKIQEAVKLARETDQSSMTSDQRVGMAWASAIAFFEAEQYSDAENNLEIVLAQPGFKFEEQAWPLMVICKARVVGPEAGRAMFDNWVRHSHPSVDRATEVWSHIQ